MEKVINHVVLEVPASLKATETPSGKPLMHKDKSIIGRKCVWNYREAAGMLSYIQGSPQPEILMAVHQCARFYNNPHIVHERAVRLITKYLVSTSTYVYLPYGNKLLTTRGKV